LKREKWIILIFSVERERKEIFHSLLELSFLARAEK